MPNKNSKVHQIADAIIEEGGSEEEAYSIANWQVKQKKSSIKGLDDLKLVVAKMQIASFDSPEYTRLSNESESQRQKKIIEALGKKQLVASLVSSSANGRWALYFLLTGDMKNGKGWGVTEESIPKYIKTFEGRPFTITSNEFIPNSPYGKEYDHPTIDHLPFLGIAKAGTYRLDDESLMERWENMFKVGTIAEVFEKNGNWWAIIDILPRFRKKDLPPFCSPSLLMDKIETEEEDSIETWHGRHLTGLDKQPAYGSIAIKKGECSGTYGECSTQLKNGSLKGLSIRKQKNAKGFVTPCEIEQVTKQLKATMSSGDFANVQKQNLYQCSDGGLAKYMKSCKNGFKKKLNATIRL